jgi:hypothetical protein
VRNNNGTVMRGEKVDKLQEYATEAQIEFFDRLRSGGDRARGARSRGGRVAAARPTTDRARFHRVMERLQAEGFYYANACCQSCGFAEAEPAGAEDIVNINDQSIARAFYGDAGCIPAKRLPATMVMPLYVAYNGRAQRIVEVFREEGFNVEWDGDWANTICVRPELWPDRPRMDRPKKGEVA